MVDFEALAEKARQKREASWRAGLDPYQLEAVEAILQMQPGSTTVLRAGAGSGKTKTVVAAVRALCEKFPNVAEDVVVATFTADAARELESRLEAQGGEVPDHVGTLHALAYRHWAPKSAIKRGKSLNMSDQSVPSVHALLSGILGDWKIPGLPEERGLGIDPEKQSEYASALDWVRAGGYSATSPEGRRRAAQVAARGEAPQIQAVWEKFEKCKKILGAWDFDDLLLAAITNAGSFAPQWIFVDEAQDTNPVQQRLVQALAAQAPARVIYVGDEWQAIYGFRGANLDFFNDMVRAAQVIELRRNYRSTPEIVQTANNFAGRSMEAASDATGGPVVSMALSAFINQIDVKRPENFAVIGRTWESLAAAESALVAAGIPYRSGKESFWSSKEVRLVAAFAAVAVRSETHDDLALLGQYPNRYLKKDWVLGLKDARRSAPTYAAAVKLQRQSLNSNQAVSALELAEMLDTLPRLSWQQTLKRIAGLYGLGKSDPGPGVRGLRAAALEAAHNVAAGQASAAEFLQRVEQGRQAALRAKKQAKAVVTLTTAHSAKGLEWHTVGVLSESFRLMPDDSPNKKREVDLGEERRLYYVAMTRAMRSLAFLTYDLRGS